MVLEGGGGGKGGSASEYHVEAVDSSEIRKLLLKQTILRMRVWSKGGEDLCTWLPVGCLLSTVVTTLDTLMYVCIFSNVNLT